MISRPGFAATRTDALRAAIARGFIALREDALALNDDDRAVLAEIGESKKPVKTTELYNRVSIPPNRIDASLQKLRARHFIADSGAIGIFVITPSGKDARARAK